MFVRSSHPVRHSAQTEQKGYAHYPYHAHYASCSRVGSNQCESTALLNPDTKIGQRFREHSLKHSQRRKGTSCCLVELFFELFVPLFILFYILIVRVDGNGKRTVDCVGRLCAVSACGSLLRGGPMGWLRDGLRGSPERQIRLGSPDSRTLVWRELAIFVFHFSSFSSLIKKKKNLVLRFIPLRLIIFLLFHSRFILFLVLMVRLLFPLVFLLRFIPLSVSHHRHYIFIFLLALALPVFSSHFLSPHFIFGTTFIIW